MALIEANVEGKQRNVSGPNISTYPILGGTNWFGSGVDYVSNRNGIVMFTYFADIIVFGGGEEAKPIENAF